MPHSGVEAADVTFIGFCITSIINVKEDVYAPLLNIYLLLAPLVTHVGEKLVTATVALAAVN